MDHPPYKFIANGLKDGMVIPFFGAAASAIYRPEKAHWEPGKPYLPFGSELAATLAERAGYRTADKAHEAALTEMLQAIEGKAAGFPLDLVKEVIEPVLRKYVGASLSLALVASWAEHVQGHRQDLDRELREAFAIECEPGMLHRKLCEVEATKLYITTNYDDLLEKALKPRKPHIVIDRGDKGLFVTTHEQSPRRVSTSGSALHDVLYPSEAEDSSRPVLFKIHGSVDKSTKSNDSFLVTEEDYIDFLSRTPDRYMPSYVGGLLDGKRILFLGYSLEDWNVRVIIRRFIQKKDSSQKSWAIVRGHSDVEQDIWKTRNLNIYSMDLVEFTNELASYL